MPWMSLLQAVETVAVVVGVVFGLFQLRQLRVQRELQAGIELLHPLQMPESGKTLLLIHSLPDNLTGEQLRERLGDDFESVLAVLSLWESLGPLVARGYVPVEMYEEFYRGPTILCWKKLRRYIEEQRKIGWPTLFEWLQWLAERMEERSLRSPDVPAFERFRSWQHPRHYRRLCGAPSRAN